MVYDIVEWSNRIANHTALTMDERDLSLTEPEVIDTLEVDEKPTFRPTSEYESTIVDIMRPCVANAYDLGYIDGYDGNLFSYPIQWARKFWTDYATGYGDGLKAKVRKGC